MLAAVALLLTALLTPSPEGAPIPCRNNPPASLVTCWVCYADKRAFPGLTGPAGGQLRLCPSKTNRPSGFRLRGLVCFPDLPLKIADRVTSNEPPEIGIEVARAGVRFPQYLATIILPYGYHSDCRR
jgi:hypothetical protein